MLAGKSLKICVGANFEISPTLVITFNVLHQKNSKISYNQIKLTKNPFTFNFFFKFIILVTKCKQTADCKHAKSKYEFDKFIKAA